MPASLGTATTSTATESEGISATESFRVDKSGKETVVHSFAGGADGATPFAALITDTAGNLYGTTASGGAGGVGTVFQMDTAGNETVLYSFTYGEDGGVPVSAMIRDAAGNIYGTTENGGALSLRDAL